MPIAWQFTPEPAGSFEHSIETVRDLATRGSGLTRLEVLVREMLQNSLDAAVDGGTDPVRVTFRLIELTGSARDAFLASMCAEEYAKQAAMSHRSERHYAATEGAVIRDPAVSAEAIDQLRSRADRKLHLLVVEDSNTIGLGGDEVGITDRSRFAALCRHDGWSVKRSKRSGGTFGIGKNVAWLHSGVRAVLVYSRFADAVDREGAQVTDRFIGVAKLPWHADLGGDVRKPVTYRGRGFLALAGSPSLSVVGPEAVSTAAALHIKRSVGDLGTSLCIVDFMPDGPTGSRAKDLESVACKFKQAAEDWFWPAIHSKRLAVGVKFERDGRVIASMDADLADGRLQAFRTAWDVAIGAQGETEGCGAVPTQAMNLVDQETGGDPLAVRAVCGVKTLTGADADHPRAWHVALVRGSHMVVAYDKVARANIGVAPCVGVQVVGLALTGPHAKDIADNGKKRLESLVATSEPEAHDYWNERLIPSSWVGATTVLRTIHAHRTDAVQKVAGTPEEPRGSGCRVIADRLDFGTRGGGSSGRPFSIEKKTSVVDGKINFLIEVSPTPRALPCRRLVVRVTAREFEDIVSQKVSNLYLPVESLALRRPPSGSEAATTSLDKQMGKECHITLPEGTSDWRLSLKAVIPLDGGLAVAASKVQVEVAVAQEDA